jgi:hypothetical protein
MEAILYFLIKLRIFSIMQYNVGLLYLTNKSILLFKECLQCEISISHGGEYEAQNLLGCTTMFLIEC